MEQQKPIPAGSQWVDKHIKEFSGSPSSRIGEEWMLITAGNTQGDWNTMTASWGGLGVLWGKDVAFIFIRPTRYTYEFANRNALFTLSFFDTSYHEALTVCGTHSGRDIDKAAKTGLTPIVFKDGAIGFKEASEIILCRKLYTYDFDPARFLDPAIENLYPDKDYHRMFIGEILWLKLGEAN
jgi:flavin reductase (DIM6/NTAB) family NADH-FMN oxidoreductase RutF